MESKNALNSSIRSQALANWLRSRCGFNVKDMKPLAGDASARRYYRLSLESNSFIAVDAPPDRENCQAFILLSKGLRKVGLRVPEVIKADVHQGFLLLEDFGDETYLRSLNAQNANTLYGQAIDALLTMQACREIEGLALPYFNQQWMMNEWAWHKEWFLEKLLGISLAKHEPALDACLTQVIHSATSQPQVFMHRDYHSANLMVLPNNVGILDFQDAFIGPMTYDLVSLLRDCYIAWPDVQVKQWVLQYWQQLQKRQLLENVDDIIFMRWFDMMSIQRHLKALFTFARKQIRDNQPAYLQHVPRTLQYIILVSKNYPEMVALSDFMNEVVSPALERKREILCVP